MPCTSKPSSFIDGPCVHVALYSSVLTPTFSSCIASQTDARDYCHAQVSPGWIHRTTRADSQLCLQKYVYRQRYYINCIFFIVFPWSSSVSPDWHHCHRQLWHWAVAADCSQQLSFDTAFSPSGIWVRLEKDSPESKFLRMLPGRSNRKWAWGMNPRTCWWSLWWMPHSWASQLFWFQSWW